MTRPTGTPRAIMASAYVRLARYQAGISVAEVARCAGVSAETVRRLEACLVDEPNQEIVRRILAACDPNPAVTA